MHRIGQWEDRKVRNLYIFQWQYVLRRRINLSPWGRIFRVKFSGKSAFFRVVSRDASVSCVVCDFSQLVADGPISGCFGLVIKKAGPRAKLGKVPKSVDVCQINQDPYKPFGRWITWSLCLKIRENVHLTSFFRLLTRKFIKIKENRMQIALKVETFVMFL